MVSLTDAEVSHLIPIVARQAKKVADRYEGVDADDLAQELWVWIAEESSPALLLYVAEDQAGRLVRSIYNAAVNWCEKDKRAWMRAAGIDWRDDYNYSRPEVARLLPLALDPQSIPGLSSGEVHDAPTGKSDPAVGGNMLASLVDVRTAYSKLSESDQQFVLTVVGLDANWNDIAATTGVKASSAYAKWMRILDRMVTRHLGRKTDEDDDE